jgi:tRNA uridine 5-carbamoylmethylation protein Kti12
VKIAVILRGVPGSGKTSFVNLMRKLSSEVSVHSVDDLHVDDHGNFLWDEENEERYYTLNFANFVRSCSEEIPIVVCDCINIHVSDFQKYVDVAKQFGYHVYVVTPELPTPAESVKRNKHHVSSAHAREMYKRWESWPSREHLEDLINENQ